MIIREGSHYFHAMPTPPRHRLLGLAPSFTGPRGLALWSPFDPPITSVTLCHGELDSRVGASVRVISAVPAAAAVRDGRRDPDLDDVAYPALAGLPHFTGEDLQTAAAALHQPKGSALWNPRELTVDGAAVPFQAYHHHDRWWVTVTVLHDVAVGVIASDTAPDNLELVTVDADLPGYEAAPVLPPQVGNPADTRARFALEGMEPVLVHAWAKDALAAGAQAPALHAVIGADLRDPGAVQRAFDAALDELGAPRFGSDEELRWQYARYMARAAVDGEIDDTGAARRIVWGTADPLGRPARLRPFVEAVQEADRHGSDEDEVEATCLDLMQDLLAT